MIIIYGRVWKWYWYPTAFVDKNSKQPKIVVCTSGFVKKDWKVPKKELEKALKIMKTYYTEK